jgi:spore coat protein A
MEQSVQFSRRTFIAWVGGASAGYYLFGRLPGESAPIALAQIPGGTLDPTNIPKYETPMLIPPVMPRAKTIKQAGGKSVDYYEISMRQFDQQILPASLPSTTVWGYGAEAAGSKRGLLIHNAPSLTIEAVWNRPVRVKWINELVGTRGRRSPRRPAPIPVRSRSSPTCTVPWA